MKFGKQWIFEKIWKFREKFGTVKKNLKFVKKNWNLEKNGNSEKIRESWDYFINLGKKFKIGEKIWEMEKNLKIWKKFENLEIKSN